MKEKEFKQGRALVGTSGYQYDHWRGLFYPEGLAKRNWFEHYLRHFSSVEVNATFYHLFKETTFEKWRSQAPEGFVYVLKLWRWITHRKRLHEAGEDILTFLSRALLLEDRLGAVLVQLPPGLHRHDERLQVFFDDWHRAERALKRPVRTALEFRHTSWFVPEVYAILRKHGAALCVADMPAINGYREVTADFIYLRLHGKPSLYYTLYSEEELGDWARWVRPFMLKGTDVYAYFDNDGDAHAVQNALQLKGMLG
jgi:uncharacterized protein YecE (DUF72 family)